MEFYLLVAGNALLYILGFTHTVGYSCDAIAHRHVRKPAHKIAVLIFALAWPLFALATITGCIKAYKDL